MAAAAVAAAADPEAAAARLPGLETSPSAQRLAALLLRAAAEPVTRALLVSALSDAELSRLNAAQSPAAWPPVYVARLLSGRIGSLSAADRLVLLSVYGELFGMASATECALLSDPDAASRRDYLLLIDRLPPARAQQLFAIFARALRSGSAPPPTVLSAAQQAQARQAVQTYFRALPPAQQERLQRAVKAPQGAPQQGAPQGDDACWLVAQTVRALLGANQDTRAIAFEVFFARVPR